MGSWNTLITPGDLLGPLVPMAVGDLFYATAVDTLGRLAAVATGSLLASAGVATAPAWSSSPTLGTSLTVPTLYGSAAANGDLTLETTSHATKDSSFLYVAPSGGQVVVGAAAGITNSLLELHNDSTVRDCLVMQDTRVGAVREWRMGAGTGAANTFGIYDATAGAVRLRIDSAGYFGFNLPVSLPDRRVEILDVAAPQVRLSHTVSTVYADLQVIADGSVKILPTGGVTELETTETLAASPADGYAGALRSDPGYTAAAAQTVTRHNYWDAQNVSVAGLGPAAVTDACLVRLDAALGTHLATTNVDKTANAKVGTIKINANGTIVHLQLYAD